MLDRKVHFLNGPIFFLSDEPKVDVESYLLVSRLRDNGMMHPGPNIGRGFHFK